MDCTCLPHTKQQWKQASLVVASLWCTDNGYIGSCNTWSNRLWSGWRPHYPSRAASCSHGVASPQVSTRLYKTWHPVITFWLMTSGPRTLWHKQDSLHSKTDCGDRKFRQSKKLDRQSKYHRLSSQADGYCLDSHLNGLNNKQIIMVAKKKTVQTLKQLLDNLD